MDVAKCDPPVGCPSCAQPMTKRALASHADAQLCLDLCYPCHAIWFDQSESVQLAPRAVVDLFRDIHARQDGPRSALAARPGCPRCREALVLTQDLTRTGRFSYWRCPTGHGRLTPFFQFLREKQFVRSLTPAELGRVRAELKVVRCSSCGAPIDLQRDTACGFCKSPLAILDADAVEKAVRVWSEAEARRGPPSREKVAAALLDMQAIESKARRDAQRWSRGKAADAGSLGGDLLGGAIEVLGDVLGAIDF
jgi:hypothetical protein